MAADIRKNRRSSRIGIAVLGVLVVVLSVLASWSVSAGTWPYCLDNCNAGDVKVDEIYVKSFSFDPVENTISIELWARFEVTATTRYCIVTVATFSRSDNCTDPIVVYKSWGDLGKGPYDRYFTTITQPAGEGLWLCASYAQWRNQISPTGCAENCTTYTSQEGASKCWGGYLDTPLVLVPEVSAPDASVCAGDIVVIVATSNAQSPAYQWYKDDQPLSDGGGISGTTSSTLVISSSSSVHAGTYWVVVTDGITGIWNKDDSTLTVYDLPDCTITAPDSVVAGSTGNVASVTDVGPGASYVWSITNGTITEGSGTPLITWTAGTDDQASLSVTVTNANGCQSSCIYYVTIVHPDLTVAKTGDAGPVSLGETVSYTIRVTNSGDVTLHNVTVVDAKLAIDQNVGDLGPGAFVDVSGSYGPVTEDDLPGPIVNTASATSDETPVPVEDDHSVAITPEEEPVIDLSLTKTVFNPTPNVGDDVTFLITVTNALGFDDATGVGVTDTLPSGYAYVGSTTSYGIYNPATGVWTIGALPSGVSVTLEITATVLEGGDYDSPTEVTAADQFDIDSTPGNAASTPEDDNDEATVAVPEPFADLAVEKSTSNPEPAEGEEFVFTITVTNNGPYNAIRAEIADVLPFGLAYVSDDSGGAYSPSTGVWTIGPLPTFTSVTLNITANPIEGTEGFEFTNAATITNSDPRDPDESNNRDEVDIRVPSGGRGGELDEPDKCAQKVIISEIAWAGTAADPAHEWIELQNVGSEPVDLTGWILRWRRKRPVTFEDYEWKVVPLSGTLSGAVASACELAEREPEPAVEFEKRETDNISWLVTAEPRDELGSYLTLERISDRTVSDIEAGLLYDLVTPYRMELSDDGDVIELLNAGGQIVDTANAFQPIQDGWPAGDPATFATMERTDPLGPDEDANWHTNIGIITNGRDASERPLVATSDATNSQSLDELAVFAELEPTRTLPGARLEVGLELTANDRKESGWPWIRTTRPTATGTVGGGGAADPEPSVYSFASRYARDLYWLGIDTGGLAPGDHLVWIVYGEGKVVLVPITILE